VFTRTTPARDSVISGVATDGQKLTLGETTSQSAEARESPG
jgi:hypothetical protein